MPPKIKSKDNKKISRKDILNNRPTHLKFNFSFITSNNSYCIENENFIEQHKLKFLERILFLSKEDIVKTYAYRKDIGIERIEKSAIKKQVEYNKKFDDVEFRKRESDSKFTIFRIYPNNNPIPARVLGKVINNVFYIMFIDLNHDLYG